MEGSNVQLSREEMELAQNAGVILTKNTVIAKTVRLLEELQQQMLANTYHKNHEAFNKPPKISRGEQYLGLPYVVLDYPRLATGPDLYFVRSMFWWGHFFSSTLQLSGHYQNRHQLAAAYDLLAAQNYHIGVATDPWQHHFEQQNYVPIRQMNPEEFSMLLDRYPHTKIAAKWPLTEWPLAANRLLESWKLLTGLVT